MFDYPITIVDVETTGTNPLYDRVIEIGLIRINPDGTSGRYTTLINPHRYVPREILQMTGIDDSQLQKAPSFEEISTQVYEYLQHSVFTAHNARFDYSFIKHEFKRLGIPYQSKTLCSVQLSRHIFPSYRHHDLSTIVSRHAIRISSRHRALDDAQAVEDFFASIVKTHGQKTLVQAAEYLLHSRLAGLKIPSVVDTLPEAPGIYKFFDSNGTCLYIGKSTNIKDRVMSHVYSDHTSSKELTLTNQIHSIEYDITPGELTALLRESEAIKTELPIYNRQLRLRKHLTYLTLTYTKQGYAQTTLTRAYRDDIVFDGKIIALFRNTKTAKELLYAKAHEHNLCPKLLGLEKSKGSCFLSQLGTCFGACIGKENPETYNARLLGSLSDITLRQWPFDHAIAITETDESIQKSTAFIVDSWIIRAVISQSEQNIEYKEYEYSFEYDTYTIIRKALEGKLKTVRVHTDRKSVIRLLRLAGLPSDSNLINQRDAK